MREERKFYGIDEDSERHQTKVVQNEAETRRKRGHTTKILLQCILRNVFESNTVSMSKYHGGKMEGQSCRQLCLQGIGSAKDVSGLIKLL